MAEKQLKSLTFPGLPDTYTIPPASDEQVQEAVDNYLDEHPTISGTMTNEAKNALLALLEKVWYTVEDGREYLDTLATELFRVSVNSISAVFTQGNVTIFDDDNKDKLRDYLVVTAELSDGTSETVTTYSLYGILTGGTSTITVVYGGKTTTFDVTVTSTTLPSDYTKVGYIASKTTNAQNAVASHFIFLKAYENIHVLSCEFEYANKTTTTASQGAFGARTNASGYNDSYSVYCNSTQNGVQIVARGSVTSTGAMPTNKTVFKLDNPSTSPMKIYVDGTLVATKEWTNTPTVATPIALFNNFPYEDTTTSWAINAQAKIGIIRLRKTDGECVGCFIPCTYSGKIGMYNVMDNTFYTAATASAVTVGNSGCHYTTGNF